MPVAKVGCELISGFQGLTPTASAEVMKCVLLLAVFCIEWGESVPPHIVFILADDLGWNDVGYHGSNQIPTPNIDALAYTGVILGNYYVTPICTPSRSALMTGKYPIHTGMQHRVIYGNEPWGLSLGETLLSDYLKRSGYATSIVGKWHLGHFRKEYLPLNRGFDSHYGYWLGRHDYYDHTAQEKGTYWGYDMRRGMNTSWSDYGSYSTDLFTEEAVKVIKEHDVSKPLFLYMAHLAVHSGNSYDPLQAPAETVAKFSKIKDRNRRIFAAMLSKLDDSVGEIVSELAKKAMLENTIIIFSTDNGGPAAGFNLNAASNWPLRGVKDTLWQGGTKGAGLIWSTSLPSGTISNSLIHITDWLPTLLSAIQKNVSLDDIDGFNQWQSLTTGEASQRTEVLINIDHQRNISGLIHKNWKLIKGHTWDGQWDKWYGPSGRDGEYDWIALQNSKASQSLKSIRPLPPKTTIQVIRHKTDITCKLNEYIKTDQRDDTSDVFLFDLSSDPCELINLATTHTEQLNFMEGLLDKYDKTVIEPRNKPADPRSDPVLWGYQWLNWMDYL